MTTELTADDYRTAAKVAQAWKYGLISECPDLWDAEAARLDAAAADDAEDLRLAEIAWNAFRDACGGSGNSYKTWDRADRASRAAAVEEIRAVRAALIPEGGMVLTADEVTDVQWLVALAGRSGDTSAIAFADRLRARFAGQPAPAEPDAGPWDRWQDVPDGVKYRSHRMGMKWQNAGGRRLYIRINGEPTPSTADESTMASYAPFVRVDGDQA